MKGKCLNSGKGQYRQQRGAEKVVADQVTWGYLIWIRLNGGSWWPAQVIDENTIGESIKPGNKSAGEVLVRLYGSYKYLYVDPVKSQSEFKRILEQNNGCYWKIFKEALEQDCPHSKSGRSKGQGSKSKAKVIIDASRDKFNQNEVKDQDIEASNHVIVSTRRQLPTITPKMKVKIGNSEKAEKEKNEASKQDGIRMNLKANSSSSAEEKAESIAPNRDRLQRKLKRVNSSGEGKKSNQNVVQKKLKLDSPNLEPTSRRAKEVARMKIPKQDGVGKRKEEAKNKSSMQGVLHKKLKPKHIGTEEGRSKTPEQDEMQKEVKPNNRSTEEESKLRITELDELLKKNKLNNPSFETPLFGKSPEISARRVKVMQGLGLIAPSGSPFHKSGHVYLQLC
ncbi:hypothetical protein F2P56_025520 [Juglans regia]|uniref:Uncharacterized protein LOC109013705 n=2 Tax=Juglans regia TaxID=51240 RepID=A0A2I4H5L2_JUGRE|nr:uncharacterized protein LOC109013705 [Juglans regia]XP_018851436.2 uncharacterized protein LOC109013705 [Juglans regia]XP_035551383.1 uncharacterized protein LOC109013705 [Juglans regia]KAF5456002.1 hypothetical protein F2P56_025520 [Juglans regia]